MLDLKRDLKVLKLIAGELRLTPLRNKQSQDYCAFKKHALNKELSGEKVCNPLVI